MSDLQRFIDAQNYNYNQFIKIERNEVKHYGNEICRARYGTVFWNS